MKSYKNRLVYAILPVFLLAFMLFIFGPTEVFFSNSTQFPIIFKEYFWVMLIVGLLFTVIVAALMALSNDRFFNIIVSIITGFSVAGYIQVMFLNKNLDLLGLNPEGNKSSAIANIINLVIWVVIIAIFIIIAIKKSDISKKINLGVPGFLIAIQLVALITLLMQGGEDAYKRKADEWYTSGEKQFTVSSDSNVIMIILDYFSNQYVDRMLAEYPDALDCMNDFTYYDNDECVYHGTFPSILHMITGYEVDPTLPLTEWIYNAWQDEKTNEFYDLVHDNGYEFNFYSEDSLIINGKNNIEETLYGHLSNVENSATVMKTDFLYTAKTMSKISSYRFMPLVAKNLFNTSYSEVQGLAVDVNYPKLHHNYDFYEKLVSEGLKVDNDNKIIAVEHLEGPHAYSTSIDCKEKDDATLEETCRGCFTLVEEYLNQLKELGVYDEATIIITSDHGSLEEPQTIFYIKESGETHDNMQVNHAPIQHCDIIPTMVKAIGGDASEFGTPVDEYNENETKLRACWEHVDDPNYPYIKNAFEDREGANNVYHIYTYEGDFSALKKLLDNHEPTYSIPMVDSFS